ncbi:E3 ubiquitin-protein ligase LNX isoform X1 [Balaenoptera musculus]|uniref:E3 ubiquitin-protein ligase LNX n=2 Tax=Balaenoptera musculus TaxID=9771 RepID=A0A8B8XE67_BALMU|nr:E3 ubiquitin-protein ligase LNX isoform X1 [Balaenoptera musculus]XP_036707869.1 E3 ubiquitin-protein ligase LNX isoform X1 [Balaenoptera musculus]XP_036707870.1 E3 ubiquitin-protein ligase LNX isoform X1 [Balaenoptera musculus]XP_036707871.1 E3 ubiquitin-protein ligase LNX isoform X1 [Balaenoptera musculus]
MNQLDPAEDPDASPAPLCVVCGQAHAPEENHFYTYTEEVDDDLICHICLQALLDPLDTPCGHTYCTLCLTNFLVEKDFCPVDRKPVVLQHCKKSSILVNKLLNKLLVTCPFTEHCAQVLQRCDLDHHFQMSCKGASHYGLTKDRKRHSQDGCPDGCASLTATALSPEVSAAAAISLMTDEPGLDNPAYVSTAEDGQPNSPLDSGRSNRTRARPFERSTIRSRSFKKINRALSVLRRTKSGSTVVNQAEQGRENSENTTAPDVFPRLYHLIPYGEITRVKINRADPNESLSIRLVGGNETPLVHIIIQHIYRDGVIARDGRLLPGDIILKVNGMDIGNVRHNYALHLLRQPCQVLWLTVLREQKVRSRSDGQPLDTYEPRDDHFHVILNKSSPEEQLGIKLVHKVDEPGVFISNVLDGGVADRHGQLEENDRVLAINGHDLRYGSPESAAHLIQASERRVHLVVSRQLQQQSPDIFQEAGWNSSGSRSPGPGDRSNPPKPLHPAVTCHEKVVSVQKDPSESLGMTVAGGASHREWNLPIYVISVEPGGVISRDGRIKTGDVLLNVNGIELTEISRSEAVALLKSTSSSVVLKALEVREREPQEEGSSPAALDSNHRVTAPPGNRSPSWVMWLELPRYLYNCKDVILRRNTAGSLGFCIVGGYEEYNGNKPFFIKSIVEGTPAYNDGRIRCGDILLAVNGRSTSGMIHACLARMLKELKGKITLTIASWPGTFL